MQERAGKEKSSDRNRSHGTPQDRPLPHNLNIEKAVLGAILTDGDCIDEAVEKFGRAKIFYSPAHQRIYETLIKLHQASVKIDHITLTKALSDQHILDEIGGEIYLAEMQNAVATTAHIESWCKILHDIAILRQLISTCTIAVDKCYDTDKEVEIILDEVESSILQARDVGAKSSILFIKDLLHGAMEYIQSLKKGEESLTGIATGFPGFDEKIIGMKKGEMIVVAARPSVGKTSFALNVVSNIALRDHNPRSVLMFSMEMTADQLTRRLLYSESGIPEKDFMADTSKAEFHKLTNAATRIQKSKIFIDPTPGLRIMELRAKARRMKSQIDLIVIDYLQLMHAETHSKVESRQLEVSMISSGIKSLAKEMSLPILVLAQLNRAAEQQRDGRPKLSNLRESGSIEQDADIVAFLHRDTDAHRDATEEEKDNGLDSELIIGKNRNGDVGREDLLFFPKIMKFGSKKRFSNEQADY